MKKAYVLVVDDDENIRQLYNDALTLAGLDVITASTGAEAIDLALAHHPVVILMDILMPGLNGHQTVEKIRQDSWGKNAKVIYLTNLSDPENVVKAIEQKPEEFIVKANTDVKEVVNQVRIAMHAK